MGDVVNVKVRSQSGDSYIIDLKIPFDKNTIPQIYEQIAATSKTSTFDLELNYKIIHQGKLLSETLLESLKDVPSLVLTKRRKFVIQKKDIENKEPITKLIEERMKGYCLPDIVIELEEEKVNLLKDMGFSEARVRNALIMHSSDTEEALNWLLSKVNDSSADDPLTQKQLREFLKKQQTFKCDETMVEALLEMGFEKGQIEQALRSTNNSLEGACAMLTGERDMASPVSGFRDIFNEAIASNPRLSRYSNSPRISEAINDVTQNPHTLQRYISDPEVGPILLEIFQHLRRLAQ